MLSYTDVLPLGFDPLSSGFLGQEIDVETNDKNSELLTDLN